MNKSILFTLFLILSAQAYSQTILEVGDKKIDASEFKQYAAEHQYSINSKETVSQALNQFIEDQLKLADAYAIGIDKEHEILTKTAIFKQSLIQDELDRELMNNLVLEVKQRLQEELCASHILIHVKQNATPEDTLIAFEHATRIRERILRGEETMASMAKRYSADVDTKYDGGNLGCFTTLHMKDYSIENKLFSMRKGEISAPFRSSQGYHIIKLDDRRPSNGMARAKQLFVRSNALQTPEKNTLAERFIYNAYREIQNGKALEDIDTDDILETSFDDIPWFTVGSYESVFENAIYSLSVGEYSRPIKTSIGWHIFQLIEQKPLPSFDQIEENIKQAIQEDQRYSLAKMNYANRLKSKHGFEKHQEHIDLFIDQVAMGISIPNWQVGSIYDLSQPFFHIGNTVYTASNFVNRVKREHQNENYQSFESYYNQYESDQIIAYHKNYLITSDPLLNKKLRAYQDELILEKYNEQTSWNKQPSIQELKAHYNLTKQQYKSPNVAKVSVYSVANQSLASKLEKQVSRKGYAGFSKLLKKNEDLFDKSSVILEENKAIINHVNLMEEDSYALATKNGTTKMYIHEEVQEGSYLPFAQANKSVAHSLSTTLKTKKINELKEKFPVKIKEGVVTSFYQ